MGACKSKNDYSHNGIGDSIHYMTRASNKTKEGSNTSDAKRNSIIHSTYVPRPEHSLLEKSARINHETLNELTETESISD